MGDVLSMAGRLVVVRDAAGVARHRNEQICARRRAAARPRRARNRALRLQRTPPWADQSEIEKLYALAERLTKRTGIPHEVDHVIPLRGQLVSGLHVHTNLQVITKQANREKSNHYEVVGGAGIEPATSTV